MKKLKKISVAILTGAVIASLAACNVNISDKNSDTSTEQPASSTDEPSSSVTSQPQSSEESSNQESTKALPSSDTNTASSGNASSDAKTSTATNTAASTSTTVKTSTTTKTSSSTATVVSTTGSSTKKTTTSTTLPETDKEENGITLTDYNGYNEGAYVEWTVASNAAADDYAVSYSADGVNFTGIDTELIRISGTTARADVIGLTSGSYIIKVNKPEGNLYSYTGTVNVSAADRSGYAHFNYTSGVGAYNDDGTLKSKAQIIYVSNATKNTVTAKIGSTNCTGLCAILSKASSSSVPLDIRILDDIQTTQWNKITYTSTAATAELIAEQKASLGGTAPSTITADTILSKGWNSYSDDLAAGITTLNGLSSKITTGSSHNSSAYSTAYDTAWNMISVGSANNVTIEGIGENAGIFQWGMTFSKCNSIEVKNLRFHNYTEDAVAFEGSGNGTGYSNYWLHNCTFDVGVNNWDLSDEQDKGDGDGSTDIKNISNMTVSYCRYNETHKTNLIGGSDSVCQYNITLHHNYYNNCSARLPLVRQSNIHIYNNYYYKNSGTGISVRANAEAFLENNYFADGKNPFNLVNNKSAYSGTAVKAIGNTFDNVSVLDSSASGVGLMANGIYVSNGDGTNTAVTNATRTTTISGATCSPAGTSLANFDTNSSLFYYDSTNKCSNVTILNDSADVPTFVKENAGAGVLHGLGLGTFNTVTPSESGSGSGGGSSTTTTTATSGTTTTKTTTTTTSTSTDTNTVMLDASSLTAATLTSDLVVNDTFTVKATSSKSVTVDASSRSIDGYSFTSRIKLGGAGAADYKSIMITTTSACTITVYGMSSSSGTARILGLYDSTFKGIDTTSFTNDGSDIGSYTFTVSTAGTYYLSSTSGGFNIYGVKVTY